MATVVVRDFLQEASDKVGPFGAGSDHAHIAAQNVKELRNLVEARLPPETPHPCTAGGGLDRPSAVAFANCVDPHGTEFIHQKRSSVQTDPLLAEEHRSFRGQLDDN